MNEYKPHILRDTISCLTDRRAGNDNCASDLKTEHSYERKALLAHLRNNFDILNKQQKSIIQKRINDFTTEEDRFAYDSESLIAADRRIIAEKAFSHIKHLTAHNALTDYALS